MDFQNRVTVERRNVGNQCRSANFITLESWRRSFEFSMIWRAFNFGVREIRFLRIWDVKVETKHQVIVFNVELNLNPESRGTLNFLLYSWTNLILSTNLSIIGQIDKLALFSCKVQYKYSPFLNLGCVILDPPGLFFRNSNLPLLHRSVWLLD